MTEQVQIPDPTPEQIEFYQNWWQGLSPDWRKAFNEVCLKRSSEEELPANAWHDLQQAPALRFAGPSAPHPNMSFELNDLSGLIALPNLQILIVIHHQITGLGELAQLPQLRSLFVHNNRIESLEGLETLVHLDQLYFQFNEVTSLEPLRSLTQLRTIYCSNNRIASLEGIEKAHAAQLINFHCLPNEGLTDATCIAFEHMMGIRCRKG